MGRQDAASLSWLVQLLSRGKAEAAENGYNFEYSYIDCSEYRTETKASRQIAREIKRSIGDPDLNIPGQGYRLRIIGIWFGR